MYDSGMDIPLNEGCLKPVSIKIPESCLLNPSPEAAVVGGNVLTSQRVVDVVLKAFEAAAASQGCMNNLTFGNDFMGYYETIAGGTHDKLLISFLVSSTAPSFPNRRRCWSWTILER